MATTDSEINNVLLHELRSKYPAVPERIVTTHMLKHKNDREKVIEVLNNEESQYMFGNTPSYDPIQRRMENLGITQAETRQRSDSASSGVSSTSTNSVSSVSSLPYGGINMYPGQQSESRQVPDSSEFNQYMSPTARNTNIPNINCDAFSSSSQVSPTPTTLGKVNKPYSRLQPIQVVHVQTSQSQVSSGSEPPSTPPRVLIQVNTRPNNSNHTPPANQFTPHHLQHQMSYPSTGTTSQKWRTGNNYNTYSSHNPSYLNVAGGISPGTHTVDRYQYRKPVSPLPPESAMGSKTHINFPSQYGNHSQQQNQWNVSSSSSSNSGQQLSQAMIFLGGAQKPGGQGCSDSRTYNSGSSSSTVYNHPAVSPNLQGSHSDSYLLSSGQASYSSPASHQQPQTTQGTSNATKPLYIKLSSQTTEVAGPPQHIYPVSDSHTLNTGSVGSPAVNSRYGNVILDGPSRAGPSSGAVNPTSYVGQLYVSEVPGGGITGNGSSSQGVESGQLFMHYPNVSNTCRVPGHPSSMGNTQPPPLPARGITPTESEHILFGGNPELVETQHISHATFQPLVSPASSQSSLSSDSSSQREIQRPRSGSVQEEAAYTQALLAFQKERMGKLKLDLESELRKLSKIRNEVNQMEKNMLDRQKTRNLNFNPHLEDVAKLRGQNMTLQADIQVMTREVDMYNNGQTPLGVLDPLEQQNFFKNMNTGQRGSIYSRPPVPAPVRDISPPPIPPRLHQVLPPPPPQPPTGSGDSDGDGEQWSCSACTFLNHPALNKCECCEMPRMNATPPTTDEFDEYHDQHQHDQLSDAGNDFELVV